MLARVLDVKVWELSEVPEHWRAKARVIVNATRAAKIHKANEQNTVMLTLDVSDLLPM